MALQRKLKALAEGLPVPFGKALSAVPFRWRFGSVYPRTLQEVARREKEPARTIAPWTYRKLRGIIEHSYQNNVAYRTICDRHKFHPSRFTTLEHLQDAPIVTKNDLRAFEVSERTTFTPGRMLINTGGTSGEPLSFYIDKNAFAREWAHMHFIWRRAGYHYRDIKLTMRGRDLGKQLVRYNAVHNEWIVNTYADRPSVLRAISLLLNKEQIRWIHGYPSIVAEIVSELASLGDPIIAKVRHHLKGVLLGSEFPAPRYVNAIQQILQRPIISWYGHSEMCVLAYEDAPNRYIPLHSYGFTEAIGASSGNQRLLGTSYWNTASPFIRYDTGDMIAAEVEDGIVRSFQIASGRVGDFVIDSSGAKIALTALIFGRHHAAFDRIQHVQVRQHIPGEMELLIVPQDESIGVEELMAGFDFSNVRMRVSPVLISNAIRTPAGKISLLVK